MALLKNNTKLLITDCGRKLLHLCDFDGTILKSVNPNNIFKDPTGVCVLVDKNEEKIFVGDEEHEKIFVLNSNFELQFQIGNGHLKHPRLMRIDNEFDKSHLYVLDYENNEITIWNSTNGSFIAKIDVETPEQIHFTQNSLFVSSHVWKSVWKDNKVIQINKGGNCIFEIDKASFEIKRRIIGNWYSPHLLKIEPNGNLQIAAK